MFKLIKSFSTTHPYKVHAIYESELPLSLSLSLLFPANSTLFLEVSSSIISVSMANYYYYYYYYYYHSSRDKAIAVVAAAAATSKTFGLLLAWTDNQPRQGNKKPDRRTDRQTDIIAGKLWISSSTIEEEL